MTQDCREECFLYGDTLYVSTMCPPLPALAEGVNENDPRCLAAKDALRADASCEAVVEGEDPDSGTLDAETDN